MERWGPALRVLGVGFYIVACIIGGIIGGLWLDRKLHTEPIFILVGLVLGLVAAAWGVYQLIISISNNNKKERR